MTNPIIEEVRAARAALAAEHGYDIRRVTEWARAQTAARKAALTQPQTKKASAKSPVTRKRREGSARAST